VDTIRDIYEGFVIYSFFTLLINYLDGEGAILELLHERLRIHFLWPLNYCFKPIQMGNPKTFLRIKQGVLQYVVFKPLFGIVIMILKEFNLYNDGYIDWWSNYLWLNLLYNISVCWAMYCLVWFYVQCEKDLKPFRPMPKFISVKSIIFLTFW
jgi:hypothetical protein